MARSLRIAFTSTQSNEDPAQELIPANVFYPHEGLYATGGGATSTSPHRNVIQGWANGTTGDYAGANGLTQTSATAYDSNVGTLVAGTATSLNVLQAVNEWLGGTYENYGFMVRRTSATGTATFHSKEAVNTSFRPRLVLTTTGGTVTLGATSDTHTTGSLTVVQSPNNLTMQAGASGFILLYFDLSAVTGTVTAASLQLTPSANATVTVGVYRTDMDQLMVCMASPLPEISRLRSTMLASPLLPIQVSKLAAVTLPLLIGFGRLSHLSSGNTSLSSETRNTR